jgi:transcriptional regulator with XRE-family HTH domain
MNNGTFLKQLGGKVKAIRKSKGLSVRALAAMCGTDYSNLSRFENGQKNLYLLSLKLIAEKLEVDLKELL